jgi:hypothetical protein
MMQEAQWKEENTEAKIVMLSLQEEIMQKQHSISYPVAK